MPTIARQSILTAHHVICDGWSLDVLIHDLCAFYSEELSGTPASLEPAESFLDYVQAVTARQRSDEFRRASSYWHAKFADGFPVLVLPTDHRVNGRREFKARRTDHAVPASVAQNLKSLAAKQGCSFFAALLSSLAIFFARVAQQRRFVIALPTAEQPVSGQPGLVGQCVNLIPFAVELREGENVGAFLKRVQSDLLAAQEHAIYTMVSLLEDLRPVAHTRGVSPISAGFTNARKFKPNELPQSGFTVDYDANPKSDESFEFYLNAVESDEGLDLHCHYDIKLFEDITIREWLATLGSIFQDVAADPSRDVLSLARLDREAAPANEILYSQIFEREVARQHSQTAIPVFASESSIDNFESDGWTPNKSEAAVAPGAHTSLAPRPGHSRDSAPTMSSSLLAATPSPRRNCSPSSSASWDTPRPLPFFTTLPLRANWRRYSFAETVKKIGKPSFPSIATAIGTPLFLPACG